jgi:uncharacterized membrane protein
MSAVELYFTLALAWTGLVGVAAIVALLWWWSRA